MMNKKIIALLMLGSIWVFCQGCSVSKEDAEVVSTTRTVSIYNEGKGFEYWLDQKAYNSQGENITTVEEEGTQITISAIVEVRQGILIIPNIEIYQDNKKVILKKINSGLYWYEVK